VRLHYICGVILLFFAGTAFAEGKYQRTKDGKTMIWNNDPKAGDAATWFGDRDVEGYATKVGTLTWYNANGTVYARYFGNMVRGKFDGMVNSHSKGKTDHALFVHGQRTTRWAAGRSPSWRVAQPRIGAIKPTARIAKANSDVGHRVSDLGSERPSSAEEELPSGKPASVAHQVSDVIFTHAAEQAVAPASAMDELRRGEGRVEDKLATKELSTLGEAENAQDLTQILDIEHQTSDVGSAGGTTVEETENAQRPTPNVQHLMEDVPAEGPPSAEGELWRGELGSAEAEIAQSRMPPSDIRRQTPDVSGKHTSEDAAPAPRPSTTPQWPQTEIDNSLQSLAQPPSSLRANPEIAASPEARPRLTKEEVIRIANATAQTRGYKRADYHRAEPQYDAVYKAWSVSYEQSAGDGMGTVGKHFSVIVDDKTKGAVFELRR